MSWKRTYGGKWYRWHFTRDFLYHLETNQGWTILLLWFLVNIWNGKESETLRYNYKLACYFGSIFIRRRGRT